MFLAEVSHNRTVSDLWTNLALVFLFVLIGGFFAASEIALVSLRESQIAKMASTSKSGKTVARLTADSNNFLSAVQIGVTLAGFFSASYGASSISPSVAPTLEKWGMSESAASTTAFIGVTLFISYLSIVFGELVPKRLAMQSADKFSIFVARPLSWITTLMKPVIWFLGFSTNVVLRLLGRDPKEKREEMDAEELRSIVAGHEALGQQERDMVVDLLSVGERTVEEIMTPRTEVEFFDSGTLIVDAQRQVSILEHSRYPVRATNDDDVVGFIHIRDLINPDPRHRTVGDLVREILFFPTGKPVLTALTEMRSNNAHLAIVIDEYGGTDGIVTLEDVVEEFIGEIQDEYDREEPELIQLKGGGNVAGLMGRAEVAKVFGEELPDGPYDTLAGFVIDQLGRMPEVGDSARWGEHVLTVAEMHGRRIERLYITHEPYNVNDLAQLDEADTK